jgi:PKD repeat protein
MLAVMGLHTPLASAAVLHGPVANPVNGHVYYLLTQQNWADSESEAVSLGGHLVTVSDQAENDWIHQTFSKFGGQSRFLWLGLNDQATENQWVWVSGETPTYRHWALGEPNDVNGEDCALLIGGSETGEWADMSCVWTSWNNLPIQGVVEAFSSVSLSSFTVSPNAGSPPLAVVFNARATSKNGTISQYQWDVDGDGVVDQTTTTGRLAHTYQVNGAYNASVTVVDSLGAMSAKSQKVTVADGPELMGKIESYQFDDTLNAVTIKVRVSNTGNQAAGAFRVNFTVSDAGKAPKVFKTSAVASLGAGANTLVTVSHTFPESIYGRQIDVQVDSARKIKEVNETNNGSQIIIRPK